MMGKSLKVNDFGGQGGSCPRRQPFQSGVNKYLQRLVLGGCVSALEVVGDMLRLGWDLGLGGQCSLGALLYFQSDPPCRAE